MSITIVCITLVVLLVLAMAKPTHYARLDMVDLTFTATEYNALLKAGDVRHPARFTPVRYVLGFTLVMRG